MSCTAIIWRVAVNYESICRHVSWMDFIDVWIFPVSLSEGEDL